MKVEKKIGLVTVLYNSESVLEGFFNSIKIQAYSNVELYIVDNNSTDNSVEVTKKLCEDLKIYYEIIENNENVGVAKGNNQGIEIGLKRNCDSILLINNDIEFKEDTISVMVNKMSEVGCKIIVPKIHYFGTNKIWYAGGKIIRSKGLTVHYGDKVQDTGQFDKDGFVDYAPTCFMIIDKEVFEKVGLMDEKYFVYYDDTDFIYRALKNGYKIYYNYKSLVLHKVSVSTGGTTSLFSIYYLYRNRLYFINKNLKGLNYIVSNCFYYLSNIKAKLFFSKEIYMKIVEAKKSGKRISKEYKDKLRSE